MPEGTVGMVLGLGGLLLLLAGVALPEGVTSPAIHILAIGALLSSAWLEHSLHLCTLFSFDRQGAELHARRCRLRGSSRRW